MRDYSGQYIGLVRITSFSHVSGGSYYWNAQCFCGEMRIISTNSFPRLRTTTGEFCKCKSQKKRKKQTWEGSLRKCRLCNKNLPKERYFNHELCVSRIDVPYGKEDYGYESHW